MKIKFKNLTRNDMPLFLEWTKKPHVKNTWFQDGYEAIDKYYDKIDGKNGYDYGFMIYLNNKPIGYIQTSDLYAYRTKCPVLKGVFTKEEPGTFCLDLFIAEEEYLNKGYGTEIVKAFVDKLFKDFNAKKILIDPACSNKRAIKCYEKAGFKVIRKEHDGVNECCVMEFMDNSIEVVKWCKKFEKQAYELLNKYEETSLFLLSNLKTYGAELGEDSYSANFKCLVKNEKVIAVFALTKIGNLILQTDRAEDYSSIIVGECLKGTVRLNGVVGDWELAKPIWDCAKGKIISFKKSPCKKSILFRLVLNNLPCVKTNHNIRYLKSSDYVGWGFLNKALLSERNLNQIEDEAAKYKRFLENIKSKYLLGLFINNKLVATASFISCVEKIGQIGDVFTVPEMRGRGLAKELVYQLALDGKTNKNLEKAVLFTGEENVVAIRLYENLGFKRIGYFGLLFGECLK